MNHTIDVLSKKAWGFIAVAALTLVSLFVMFSLQNVHAASPDEGRLVTIHDKGAEKVIVTKADTVETALKQARISVRPDDSVDPELDTKLTANSYQINVYRAQPVLVVDGNSRQTVMTPFETAKQITSAAGLPLYPEDETTLNRSSDVLASDGTGLQLSIKRATKFTLVLYGKAIEARTQETTVGDMLKSKKIVLGKDDTVSVPLSTLVSANMSVEVWRNGKQTVSEEQEIPFPIQQVKDADKEVGYKQVKTPGVNGKKMVSFEVEMKNGQEVSRRVIQEVLTVQPQQQVEIIGTKMANTFGGDFAAALARLRGCEGSYTSNTGNGYYGAYQYDLQTWGNYQGYPHAAAAPPAVQDQKAWETYQRRGWQPWPSCARSQGLQDIYR